MTSARPFFARAGILVAPLLAGAALLFCSGSAGAELRLTRYHGDGMVLQRGEPAAIRGFASPGATITVTFAGQRKNAETGKNGEWSVTLDALSPGIRGQKLIASDGRNSVSLSDVVVGDVFLFARQTTIDITLGRDQAGRSEASTHVSNPRFRAVKINTIPSHGELSDLPEKAVSSWRVVDGDRALLAGYVVFQMAEVAVPRELFARILERIGRLRLESG